MCEDQPCLSRKQIQRHVRQCENLTAYSLVEPGNTHVDVPVTTKKQQEMQRSASEAKTNTHISRLLCITKAVRVELFPFALCQCTTSATKLS